MGRLIDGLHAIRSGDLVTVSAVEYEAQVADGLGRQSEQEEGYHSALFVNRHQCEVGSCRIQGFVGHAGGAIL